MNITNKDFETIEKALMIFVGDEFIRLKPEQQQLLIEADDVMINLAKKKKANNDRTSKYIAEKRKTNKNYAR